VIEFESVGKTFRDGTAAVVDLSLTVPSDKITVIVGPSGCGKTTTLRMVNRMIEPSSGRLLWDGKPLRSMRKTTLRRQMGYVIQSGGLFPHRTVLDNIGTVPGLLGWDKSKTRDRGLALLDDVGLDRKLADRFPAQLSGGQQQRVGVARALAADPLVMLMDEPFSAVDPVVRSELHELFLGLQRQLSKTIILITHDIDEAIKLGDQVAILRVGGVLAQVGTPQQLLDEPADAFVEGFVGRDRGFRALSFLPASSLALNRVRAVRDPASATAPEPTLVVDAQATPQGWVDGRRPGQVFGLGSTFNPETDSLRAALDAALTSPVGVAVAVANGRYAGVVSAKDILAAATVSRAAVADSVSVRSDGATDGTASDLAVPASDGGGSQVDDRGASSAAGSHALQATAVSDTAVVVSDTAVPDSAASDTAVPDSAASDTADSDSAASDHASPDSTGRDGGGSAAASTQPAATEPADAEPAVGSPVLDSPATVQVDASRPSGSEVDDAPRAAGASDGHDQSEPVAEDRRSAPSDPGPRVGGSHPFAAPAAAGPGDETQAEETRVAQRPGEQASWVQGRPVHEAGRPERAPAGRESVGRAFEGRGSEEPGAARDEFDADRSPWNPFKRPQ
jgi:osmoprotectant transport system ATP-binding protein